MRKNFKCYACVYCSQCDECLEEKCSGMDYVLFTTKEDKELCDLMCSEEKEGENEDEN